MAYVHKGCKTCRRATDLLEDRGVSFEAREIYEDTPTKAELRALLDRMKLAPRDLLRPRDRAYRELNLKERRDALSEEEILELMVEHPGLIRRPLLAWGDRAALGLKEEDVARFLQEEA